MGNIESMSTEELVERYKVTRHGDMIRFAVPAGSADDMAIVARQREIVAYLKQRDSFEELRASRLAGVPGLVQMRRCVQQWQDFAAALQQAQGDPAALDALQTPEQTVVQMQLRYPVAAAYQTAEGYAESSDLTQHTLGVKAQEALLQGSVPAETIRQMIEDWQAYAQP